MEILYFCKSVAKIPVLLLQGAKLQIAGLLAQSCEFEQNRGQQMLQIEGRLLHSNPHHRIHQIKSYNYFLFALIFNFQASLTLCSAFWLILIFRHLPPSIIYTISLFIQISKQLNELMSQRSDNPQNRIQDSPRQDIYANDISKHPASLQQLLPCPGQSYEYVKNYSVHTSIEAANNFPLHVYFRQKYTKLSLHQQVAIFRQYFETQNFKTQLKLTPTHKQILNQGLSLFTKVPSNPIVFLFIEPYGSLKEIVTLKNYNGQIIHFQIIQKNRKRNSIILQIRRKMKGKPFIVIKDSGHFQASGGTCGNLLSTEILKKLHNCIKIYYVKVVNNGVELQYIKKQFFDAGPNNSKVCHRNYEQKFDLQINQQQSLFYVYSLDKGELACSETVEDVKNKLYNHAQQLIKQQKEFVQANTVWKRCKCRLRVFDYLLINFIKSGKSKQKLIEIIEKNSNKYMYSMDEVDANNGHFPGKTLNSHLCKNCQALGKPKKKKSKYKCLACSKNFQTDITLCIQCFGDFHEIVLPVCQNTAAKDIKRVYQAHAIQNGDRIFSGPRLDHEKAQLQYTGDQEINQTIKMLDDNMTQIEKIIEELSQSMSGARIVKQFNELLFIHCLQGLNQIMMHVNMENASYIQNERGTSSEDGSPTPDSMGSDIQS